jgi:hypothetical protein
MRSYRHPPGPIWLHLLIIAGAAAFLIWAGYTVATA